MGSFGISEGNITRNTHTQTHTHTHTHNMRLTTVTRGEMAQTLTSASSEWELGREVLAASVLSVRSGIECPEDNLRELT